MMLYPHENCTAAMREFGTFDCLFPEDAMVTLKKDGSEGRN